MPTKALAYTTIAALAIATAFIPPAWSASVHATAAMQDGRITVDLAGANTLSGTPEVDPTLIIVRVPGVLDAPHGVLRPVLLLPQIASLVIAQHDPATIWVVAHLRAPVAVDIRRGSGGLVLALSAPGHAGHRSAVPVLPLLWHATVTPTSLFSIHWHGMPLDTGAVLLQQLAHHTIRVEPQCRGPVTITAHDVPLATLLARIASKRGCRATAGGGAFTISPY